jgi:hypothetical protein
MFVVEPYNSLSPFGQEVDAFKSAYRIPFTKIAMASGVNYQHMRDVMYGNRSGKNGAVDKVRAFMEEYRKDKEEE